MKTLLSLVFKWFISLLPITNFLNVTYKLTKVKLIPKVVKLFILPQTNTSLNFLQLCFFPVVHVNVYDIIRLLSGSDLATA